LAIDARHMKSLFRRVSHTGLESRTRSHPYDTQASNPGLADRVPGRSAAHTCAPRLGQGKCNAALGALDEAKVDLDLITSMDPDLC